MSENYCYDITKYYTKIFLIISVVLGIPVIALLLYYRSEVNKCIIEQVKNNVTIIEAVKGCNDFGRLFILFLFIQFSVIVIGQSLQEDKHLDNKPVKPDNSDLEIEANVNL